MGSGIKVAIAAAAAVAVAAFLWLQPEPPVAPGSQLAASTSSPVSANAPVTSPQGDNALADAPRREVVVPAAAAAVSAPYGSLLVRVSWHDGTPAPDIAIDFLAKGEPQLDRNESRVVSDADGIARAERLHAGAVTLTSDRGGTVAAEVAAGVVREVDFALPRGVDVIGAVVDERQRPIPGANVLLVSPRSGWLGGRVVAVTRVDGSFAVHAVEPTWSLGARAAGYAPSPLVDLETIEQPPGATSVKVQLQLIHPGASVAGTVVDESGMGIADAIVVLGRGLGGHREAEHTRESWSPQVVVTGADGSFRCDGVEPGQQQIAAQAEGCTRAVETVPCVAGEAVSITLALARGVTVLGTVRDEAGKVVAEAVVMALVAPAVDVPIHFAILRGSETKRPQTRSDAEGRFLLRGVPPGDLHLVAAKPSGMTQFDGVCQASLAGRAGDELTWDPVLVAGKVLRVRLVDADGKPCMQGQLQAYAEQPAGAAAQLSVLPERKPIGLYVFTDCVDVPYTIVARVLKMGSESRWVYLRGIRPGGPDVELRLPPMPPPGATGEVSGRIADLGHRLDGKPLSVSLNTREMRSHPVVKGDRFLAKDVLPGHYFITANAGDDTVLVGPWFELQPSQQLDLGDLATEPGASLRIALNAPAGAALGTPAGNLESGYQWRRLTWDGSHLVADNVTVGRHRLTLINGWHTPPRDFELVAGRDNLITIDVVPATMRRYEFVLPLPGQWQRGDITLRDAQGNVVSELTGLTSSGVGLAPYLWNAHQPFGEFTLEAVLDGHRRSWPVDLRDPATADRLLRFSLR